MTDVVYSGLVTANEMRQIIASCHFTSEAFFLAEQLPMRIINTHEERQNLLQFLHFSGDLPFVDYSSGRIFQADRELRWEKQGEKLRVVYIGAAESEAGLRDLRLHQNTEVSRLKERSTCYYLFGERLRSDDLNKMGKGFQSGDFAEVRIPRLLRYPVPDDPKRYARLIACEYLDPETDQIMLFRFQHLEAWDGES